MLREEIKSKDFIIKDLLQTIKEIKTKSVSVQSITSCMSGSESNLVPANNSVAIQDVYNNNGEIADTNDEILIPDKKNINDNIFKKSMQNQLEEVIREKKEKFYKFKNSDNKNSEPVARNNDRETQEKYPDGTAVIIGDPILYDIIQKRKSFITDNLPTCKVVISTPTLRTDDGKAALTVSQLTNHLLQLDSH